MGKLCASAEAMSSSDLDLAVVDVPDFLEMLGVENVRSEIKEARFSCPYPAHSFGDKNPSAYMSLETTQFICFSCGASGNAITFLADIKNVSRIVAKNWIAQKWAPEYAEIDNLHNFIQGMFDRVDKEETVKIFTPLDEAEYSCRAVDWHAGQFGFWWDYMLNRGLSPEILNRFDVCYDPHADRPCITVRSREGGLVGFKGRAYREEQWPKYMVIGDTPRTLEAHGELYGFAPYEASEHVFASNLAEPKDGTLIVCEGELNVISMHDKGFSNVVGPSGSTLSDKQVQDIVSMCDEVVLLFDTDAGTHQSYTTAKIKLLKAISAFDPFVHVRVCADHEGDPLEIDRDNLVELVDQACGSTVYRLLQYVE